MVAVEQLPRRDRNISSKTLAIALERAAREHKVSAADIMGRSRLRTIVKARHMTIRLLSAQNFSTGRIGVAMGLDHTTVMHALRAGPLGPQVSDIELWHRLGRAA